MTDSLGEEHRAATSAMIAAKRDQLLAERQQLSAMRTDILTRMRRNDRELSDCRAAARLFGLEIEFPPDEDEERNAIMTRREAEARYEALRRRAETAVNAARAIVERVETPPRAVIQSALPHTAASRTPTTQVVSNPTKPTPPALRDFVLRHLERSGTSGSKAAPIRELYERTYGRILHEKTVGMTLYRLAKDGLVRRDGRTWFLAKPVEAETRNPGADTPGQFKMLE